MKNYGPPGAFSLRTLTYLVCDPDDTCSFEGVRVEAKRIGIQNLSIKCKDAKYNRFVKKLTIMILIF